MTHPNSAADVWLVRHPETDWNRDRRYQGRSDRPFTDRGRAQLQAIAEVFREIPVGVIVTSGLQRTDAVAKAIGSCREHTQLTKDDRWCEIDHGRWEGLTYLEVRERFGDHAGKRLEAPCHFDAHGGETLAQLADRVARAWDALPRAVNGCCVIVSHATPIQALLCHLLQMPLDRYWQLRIDLASLTRITRHSEGAVIQSTNRMVMTLPEVNRHG